MNNRHNSFDDITKLIDTTNFIDPFVYNINPRKIQSTNTNNNNNNNVNGLSPLSLSLDHLMNLDTTTTNSWLFNAGGVNSFLNDLHTPTASSTQAPTLQPVIIESTNNYCSSSSSDNNSSNTVNYISNTNTTINDNVDCTYETIMSTSPSQILNANASAISISASSSSSSSSPPASTSSKVSIPMIHDHHHQQQHHFVDKSSLYLNFNHHHHHTTTTPASFLSISPNMNSFATNASTSPSSYLNLNTNAFINQNSTIKTFLDTDRETICINSSSGLSRSNSQPDLTMNNNVEKTPSQLKVRRHPSFSCKTSMSECSEEFYIDLNEINTTTTDDGIFLGTDAISDFLSGGTFSDILDDLPDLEGLMSVVTFDSTPWPKHTQCDINLDDTSTTSNVSTDITNAESRTTRSAPPSPTPMRKKKSQTWPWHKNWSKMSSEEHTSAVECLTRIVNDEMGLREQLEIIRIINQDAKFRPTDTQFVIDLNMIDDEKFRRIKDIIKSHGLKFNEKQISDNCSECSANSCPQGYKMTKRELRLRRAQQRLIKHTQRKESRQLKESKSGLFIKTEVIPLSQVLPEEDIEVDILS